jgi:hypothetical protein
MGFPPVLVFDYCPKRIRKQREIVPMTELSEPVKLDDIEKIDGKKNILLIAPHGVESEPDDDKGTAELTRKIRDILGCTAVINTVFRKPTGKKPEKRNNGTPSFKAKVLNLNLVKQAEQVPEFISSIKDVVDSEGLTYVFWIHGIKDENITKNTDCLIGYGQPNKEEQAHFTSEERTVQELVNQFLANGIKAVKAAANSNYRGWKTSNMNQWLRLEGYRFEQAQSIQLEFKQTGIRDKDCIKSSSKKIAAAISALTRRLETVKNADKSV